jgi:PKD repeat protein
MNPEVRSVEMSRVTALAVLVLLAACSSSPTAVTPPPSGAASLTVTAGDAQEAAPGGWVAVSPAVLVKNAAGDPVAGVPVRFTVDSGGGIVSDATVTTNATGVATLGRWTLGPAAGHNVLRVTVSGLLPAFVNAMAVAGLPLTIADTTIGAGGGSIVYTRPGDPLNGLTLTIPAGAFPNAGHWAIDVTPAASGPTNPGLHIAAPIISVTTDQGMADQLITLKIPLHITSDSAGTAFAYDDATGYLELLPLVASDANSITIGTRHFSPDLLVEPPGASGSIRTFRVARFMSPPAPIKFKIITSTMGLAALLNGPVVSDFELGFDEWEFGDHGSYITRDGQQSGASLSELYYHLNLESGLFNAPPLGGRYAQGQFWAGDPWGYRIAALAEADLHWSQVASIVQSMPTGKDGAEFAALADAINLTKRPQLIAMTAPGATIALVAYAMNLGEILAADPNNPGTPVHIKFDGTNFLPVAYALCGGGCPMTFTSFHLLGVGALVNMKATGNPVGARFAQLPNGPVGIQEFPPYALEYFDETLGAWQPVAANNILPIDWQDLRLRAHCASCARQIPNVTPSDLVALDVYDTGPTQLATDRTVGEVTVNLPTGNTTIGVHILGGIPDAAGTTVWRHIDFEYLHVSASKIQILPNPATALVGTPLTLTATNVVTLPPPIRYDWDFGDRQTVSVNDNPAVSHTWTAGASYTVKVTLVNPTTGFAIGTATSIVNVGLPVPVWRFDTYVTTGASGPPGAVYSGIGDILADADFVDGLPTCPGCGLLVFQATPVTVNFAGGQRTYQPGLYLQWANLGFPRTGFDPVTAEVRSLILGGPVGSLTGGSYVGQSIESMFSVLGPQSIWSINAVKNGNQMTGTIIKTQHIWDTTVPGTPFLGDDIWSYSFTATRIQ